MREAEQVVCQRPSRTVLAVTYVLLTLINVEIGHEIYLTPYKFGFYDILNKTVLNFTVSSLVN